MCGLKETYNFTHQDILINMLKEFRIDNKTANTRQASSMIEQRARKMKVAFRPYQKIVNPSLYFIRPI